jgi:hypothetical protein
MARWQRGLGSARCRQGRKHGGAARVAGASVVAHMYVRVHVRVRVHDCVCMRVTQSAGVHETWMPMARLRRWSGDGTLEGIDHHGKQANTAKKEGLDSQKARPWVRLRDVRPCAGVRGAGTVK